MLDLQKYIKISTISINLSNFFKKFKFYDIFGSENTCIKLTKFGHFGPKMQIFGYFWQFFGLIR